AAPTLGDVSEVQAASGYASGAFTYQVKTATTYDSIGRPTASYDPLGHKTTTAYTTNAYGLITGVTTTNALSRTSSVTLDPLRGVTTSATDANGIATT